MRWKGSVPAAQTKLVHFVGRGRLWRRHTVGMSGRAGRRRWDTVGSATGLGEEGDEVEVEWTLGERERLEAAMVPGGCESSRPPGSGSSPWALEALRLVLLST